MSDQKLIDQVRIVDEVVVALKMAGVREVGAGIGLTTIVDAALTRAGVWDLLGVPDEG